MVFYWLLQRVPGGDGVRVFVGTVTLLGAGEPCFLPEEVEQAMADRDKVGLYHGRNWRRLPGFLTRASELRHLNLAFNQLSSIEALGTLSVLEFLDVSHNRLTWLSVPRSLRVLRAHANCLGGAHRDGPSESRPPVLEGLAELKSLVELWLGHNLIEKLSEVLRLRGLPLKVLKLAPNKACDGHGYRNIVLSLLPGLGYLDETRVDDARRARAAAYAETLDGQGLMHRLRAEERQTDLIAARLHPRPPPQKNVRHPRPRRRRQRGDRAAPVAPDATFADVLEALPAVPVVSSKPRRPRRVVVEAPAPPTTRARWPAATFEPVLVNYAGGVLAACAPGDGSAVVRWPRGGVAVAADAGCIRAFYENGTLAVLCDAAGNAAVTSVDGRAVLSLSADGGGFTGDAAWTDDATAPDAPLEFALRGSATRAAADMGVRVDVGARFARVFFDHRGIKCCVAQHGELTILPPDTDVFGRPIAAAAAAAAAKGRRVGGGRRRRSPDAPSSQLAEDGVAPPQSHADLIDRIRQATASLP
ncbi:hypothetical protein CTAYLR_001516 [Chrysophaeum taylorii]|uniref:Uncharacterized protein n=1 Tax=Chrysophaeum taylorii TaxID=2483200 RepID=A0AAD7UD98_9STRA|nr:hypothetical protein CTAYLR_001516 [Chrysophaeum taylorii]